VLYAAVAPVFPWLDSLPVTGITGVGLVVLLYIGQTRGWWYVKPQVDDMRKAWEARIEEARHDRDVRVEEVRRDLESRLAEVRQDRDARIAEIQRAYEKRLEEAALERDHYREAVSVGQEAQRVMLAQMEDLIDANRTSHAALESIARAGGAQT